MVLVLLPRLKLSVTLFSRMVAAPMAVAYAPGVSRGTEYGHFKSAIDVFFLVQLAPFGPVPAVAGTVADAAPPAAVTR